MKLYGEISKTEAQDDGTIKVEGYASSTSIDSDGEIVTADAMKAAIPEYMKFGAVREMHQPKAAGTAIEATVQDDGRSFFKAHIVDTEAVKKVNAGVYKGFSIGGKVTSRDELNKATVTGLKLVEISLVDRPANEDAIFSLVKFEDGEQPAEKDCWTDLKKYDQWGASYDATIALDALNSIQDLFGNEATETTPDAAQLAILQSVIRQIKAFMILELKEDDKDVAAAVADASPDIALAATTDDLSKAGAEISAKNKATAQAIHAHEYHWALHAPRKQGSDDLHKIEDLQKSIAGLSEENETLKKSVTGLTEELDKIKAEPEPAKAILKAVAITKTEDGEGIASYDACIIKDERGQINEAASLMKAVRRGPA